MNSSKLLTYGKSGQLKLTNKRRLECMSECIKNPGCISILTSQSNLHGQKICLLQTGVYFDMIECKGDSDCINIYCVYNIVNS